MWYESEMGVQIAGGYEQCMRRRAERERQRVQAGDSQTGSRKQQERPNSGNPKPNVACVTIATEARSGSEPEASRRQQQQSEAAGGSGGDKATRKSEKKERRRQRVEEKLGAAAAENVVVGVTAAAAAAEAGEIANLKDQEKLQQMTQEAPEMELDESDAVGSQEPTASTHKAEQLKGQDKDQSKKEKEKRRRLKRRQKAAEAKATAAEEGQQCSQ